MDTYPGSRTLSCTNIISYTLNLSTFIIIIKIPESLMLLINHKLLILFLNKYDISIKNYKG